MSSWTNLLQSSNEYEKGVLDYLDRAFATEAIGDQIICPCKECYRRFWFRGDKVYNHLIANGIMPGTEGWLCDENNTSSTKNTNVDNSPAFLDDMERLIYDTHRDVATMFPRDHEGVGEEANTEAKKFYRLIEEGNEELYPGCKTFSKLSFLIRMFLLKCKHGTTNTAFKDYLQLFREAVPDSKLPKSYNEAKKVVKDLGDDRFVLLPKASFSMTKEEKRIFCGVIKKAKLPQGCSSNLARYLGKLKSYVKNRNRPEASIAEGYLAEECLVFCSRYLNDGEKMRSKGSNQSHKTDNKATNEGSSLFPITGYPLGRKKKGKKGNAFSLDSKTRTLAHRYVLFNCEDEQVQYYIEEHEKVVKNKSKNKRNRRWKEAQQHSNELMDWFKVKIESANVSYPIKWLSLGPSTTARRYVGYFCNGYNFYTKEHDEKCKTQNSGVSLTALTSSFASSKDCNPILGQSRDTYESKVLEPDDDINLAPVNDEDISWCRGDACDRVQVQQINISSDLSVDTFDDDSDIDETDWDWMEPLN
ncbi:unnamed protein product [Amaranthus hypochondriacus]